VDDYGLRYLMVHLYAVRNDVSHRPELYQLICQPFMQQKRLRCGSHQPFAADVALAIEAASAEEPPNILELVRGSLLNATLGSLATLIDPEVLGVLARVDQVANAQGHAALIHDVAKRSQAYSFIGEALLERNQRHEAKEPLLQALSAAEAIRDERQQAQAVSRVMQALARAGEVGRALAAVQAIEHESYKARALRELAQTLVAIGEQGEAVTVVNHMLAELPKQRLTIDQRLSAELRGSPDWRPSQEFLLLRRKRLAIKDALGKAYRLRELAKALALTGQRTESIQMVSQALAVVEEIAEQEVTISESELIADALSEVALVLAQAGEKGQATVVAEQALIAANAIARWNHLRKEDVQCKVAEVMVQTGDQAGLKRVLSALVAFERKDTFYELSWVAEVMAQAGDKADAREVIHQAFAAVKALEVEPVKAEALGRVAQVLATVGESEGLSQVLAAVEPIKDLPSKTSVLSSVAQVLAHMGETGKAADIAKQAFATAMKIETQWQQADALGRVAEALALAGEFDKALATVAQSGAQANRARMLGRVAQALVERGEYEKAAEVANQSVASAETIGNVGAIARALSRVAQVLAMVGKKDHAAEIANRALAVAETIEGEPERRAALGTVAQALALSGEFEKALTTLTAVAVKDKMQPAYMLSGVATALALAGAKGQAAAVARQALASAVEMRDRDSRDYDLKEAVQALALAGEWDQALEATKKVETSWLREYALVEVVQILAQAGQYKMALEAVTNVSGTTRADVRSRLSLALAQVGETGEAVELANQAVVSATDGRLEVDTEVRVLSRAAQTLALAGDMDRAVSIANCALAAVTKVRQEWIKAIALSGVTQAFVLAGEKSRAAHAAKQALSAAIVIEKNIPANRQEEAVNSVAEALTVAGQHEYVIGAYGPEFRLASTMGRERVFEMLRDAARLIAAIDQGRTLWDLYNTVMAVESWWTTSS
jgi:tetratricopeptide (TPR) repeat protein